LASREASSGGRRTAESRRVRRPALIEAQLSVATLAHYRLHLVPRRPVEAWPLITLRPRYGLPMVIERLATGVRPAAV
jgi:hypothetical protein